MPYSLVYGFEVVIPAEIGLTMSRITNYDEEVSQDELRANLDFLKER